MSRPASLPEWASDANYPAGTDAWSATPTKVEPTAGEKDTGAVPLEGFGAQQLNWLFSHQGEWLEHLRSMLTGSGFHVRDDFTEAIGGTVDTFKWDPNATGTGVAPVLVDDSAAGAFGAVQLELGANGGVSEITVTKLPIGTKDLHISCRIRKTTTVGTTAELRVGMLGDAGTADDLQFRAIVNGNWQRKLGSTSTDDLGVALSTSYQSLELVRVSGVVYFFINGTQVYTGSFADDIGTGTFYVRLFDVNNNANAARVDMLSMWVDR